MVFENLLKPRHLKRFLLALLAGVAAFAVYFSAEFFQVVPATGALDVETEQAPHLGAHSILVSMEVSGAPEGLQNSVETQPVALELIRQLGRVPGIEVIAAGSAFSLAMDTAPSGLAELDAAWRLGIRNIGNQSDPRLIAHLRKRRGEPESLAIRQEAGSRDLALFVQNVVDTVAQKLGAAEGAVPDTTPRVAPRQYREFLIARFRSLGGVKDLAMAEQMFDEILEQSPEWAPALAEKARILLIRAGALTVESPERGNLVEEARGLLSQAVEASPDLPEAHLYQSALFHRHDWNWEAALEAAQQAVALAPGDTEVLSAASTAAFTLGRFEKGKAWLERAITLDPLALHHRLKLGLMQEFSGDLDGAVETYRALMVKQPDYPAAHACLGRALLLLGRAQSALLHAEVEPSAFWKRYTTTLALYGLGRTQEADAALTELEALHGAEAAFQIAEVHAYAGHTKEAFNWLDRAVELKDPGVTELVGNNLLESLVEDSRWGALLAELQLPEEPEIADAL